MTLVVFAPITVNNLEKEVYAQAKNKKAAEEEISFHAATHRWKWLLYSNAVGKGCVLYTIAIAMRSAGRK